MSRATSDYQENMLRAREEEGRGHYYPAERRVEGGVSLPLLLGGLVAAGLIGFVLWDYFGPDLKRYMKIRDM
jgi:hypothetical protein